MIRYDHLTRRKIAAVDLTEASGCFVQLAEGKLTLATEDTAPAKVYGCLLDVAEANLPCDLALPGFAGIVDVKVAAGSPGVTEGALLALAADGAVDTAAEGKTVVAVALGDAAAGELVDARLVQPFKATADAVALSAAAQPVATAKKTSNAK